MLDIDGWQEIMATMRRNKLRTMLTAVGVIWGIFILIVMLGVGRGLEVGVSQSMGGFATNAVYMWGRRTTLPYAGLQPGRRVEFNNADTAAIAAQVDGLEHLAPRNQLGGFRGGAVVKRRDKTGSFTVAGDMPQLQYIQPMRILRGRFLNDIDIHDYRKVAVIGQAVQEQLFGPGEDPIGQAIAVNGVYFQVVGTFAPTATGDSADRQSQTVFTPFSTFQRAFNMGDRVGWYAFTVRADVGAAKAEEQVKALLSERHGISPDDAQALGSYNAQEDFEKVQSLFAGIRGIIWFAGVMTLLAGIIGVINIMLISVKERTQEIGIRKALGAPRRSIVGMVLKESVLITSMAGCLGILAGVAVIEQIAAQPIESDMFAAPTVSFVATLVATAILIFAGAVAGLLPALHAAGVDPVQALRAE
ncbi:ABC transporter permease [Haliangium sp.]|uniref:ABC transporter permease n=1 Tax=Haliangium sp. TaxID=2663208 RepID=UPI003D14E1FD